MPIQAEEGYNLVRYTCEKLGITQAELAKRINMNKAYVSRLANNYVAINKKVKAKLIALLTPVTKEEVSYDAVNHPSHYNQGKMEIIDVMINTMTNEELEGYLKGNIIKYVSRYKYKSGLEDLRKAQWYLDKLIETTRGG